MTEAEWLTCENPLTMISFLKGKASDRKFRPFAVEYCRLVRFAWGADQRILDGFETIAARGEEGGTASYWEPIWNQVFLAVSANPGSSGSAVLAAKSAAGRGLKYHHCVRVAEKSAAAFGKAGSGKVLRGKRRQARLLRELCGPLLFCPFTFLPEWRTSTVLTLAQQMYDTRDFSGMPILADALQDAGCEDEAVPTHCRGSGPHVRGCWCVDTCLGKS